MKIRKQKLTFLCTIIIIMVISLSASGCKKIQEDDKQNEAGDKLLIGFSLPTFKEDRWLRDRDIFVSKVNEAGYEVIVTNANNDKELQYKQVEEMIKRNIDILVIAPHDADDAARAAKLAKEAGVPVISYDRLIRNAEVDAYVSFDNVKVGNLLAKGLIEAAPEGGYIIKNGSQNDNNSIMFREGYMNELQPYIESGKITIVSGTQLLTIYKPINKLGDITLEICNALINHQALDYNVSIHNGSSEIPYIMIDVIAVTKDNMDETVIKDGFHLKEDIYRETGN